MTASLSLANDISEFQRLACAIEEFGSDHLLTEHVVYNGTLALEEVFSNIINYAYDDQNVHSITCQMYIENAQLNLAIMDDGRPFNPLSSPPPDIDAPLENRCIGGLGIHMMRELTDAIDYRRIEGKNVLTLKINLNDSSSR